jgi:murein L,D-transpeptidase YcbB/YkuD
MPIALPLTRRQACAAGLAVVWPLPASLSAAEATPWLLAGRPTPAATRAVALLAQAGDHGLEPEDYGTGRLAAAVAEAAARPLEEPAASELARQLDVSFKRYLRHLHQGRIDPRQIHHDFDAVRRPPFEPQAVLLQALAQGRLDTAVAAAVPALAQYDRLRAMLARCRALADHPAWRTPLPLPLPLPLPPAPVRRGTAAPAPRLPVPADMPAAGRALLVQRLRAWGDLAEGAGAQASAAPIAPAGGGLASVAPSAPTDGTPASATSTAPAGGAPASVAPSAPAGVARASATPSTAADGATSATPGDAPDAALAEALRGFQARHGLAEDGRYGPATRRALQVTPAERARKIELTLERLRWTPLLQAPRMIVVNIPEFRLRAYEVVNGRVQVRHEMRVVVGAALRHRTPLFDEDMRFIEFGPYWNVPPSIARQELVPRLQRDPGHLAREGFEFVGPGGAVDSVVTPERLRAVLAGSWRLRQRPGERNALGDVKFVFPNRDAIYLHHTPATGLFAQARRDFSHGCIRVEDPVTLASFVMQGMPWWDAAAIRQTMATAHSRTVSLAQPVPVLIAYGTALVKAGRMHFFDDIYGHDRSLDAALRRVSGARAAS